MAQKRLIDKKISVSEQVANLSIEAQLIFTWSIVHADDIGLLPYSLRTLKALIVPMLDMDLATFTKFWNEIVTSGLVVPVQHEDSNFYRLVKFNEHQTLKKDRQPQTLLKMALNKDASKSWQAVERVAEDIGFHLEDIGIHLESELNGIEENRREENNASAKPKRRVKEKVIQETQPEIPFVLKDEIQKLENDPKRHIQIIGLYLKERRPDIRSKAQLSAAIKRHSKAAVAMSSFDDDQIIKAFRKAKEQTPEWVIETALKMATK